MFIDRQSDLLCSFDSNAHCVTIAENATSNKHTRDRTRNVVSLSTRAASTPSPIRTLAARFLGPRCRFRYGASRFQHSDDRTSTFLLVETLITIHQIHRLKIDLGEAAKEYTKPGQFIQIKVDDTKPAFMAIASSPNDAVSEIELIVKSSGDTAERLCSLRSGDF